jgi:type I restriction enzyme, S subunit
MVKVVSIRDCVKKTEQLDPIKLDREFITYVDISSIDRVTKRIIDPQTLPPHEAPSRARKHIKKDDILISTVRPNLNTVAIVPSEYDDEIASTGFCVLRANPTIIQSDYLFYYIQTHEFIEHLTKLSIGAGYPAVSDNDILDAEIPLPPLEEQQRIAQIASKCDRIRRTRRYTQQLSDTYLQSVFLEMFGDPVTNPEKWPIEKLESQLQNIESGWSPVCAEVPRSNSDEWAVLKLGAVTGGSFKPDENKLFPDDLTPRPELEVRKGDLLITRKNTLELVAACVLICAECPQLMIPDTIFRFVLEEDSEVIKEYLWGLFNNTFFRKRVQTLATGTAGSMPNISKAKFLNILLPIPPIDLQKQFAQIVQKYDRIRTQQREAARQAEHLFQTTLHRAFSGEL